MSAASLVSDLRNATPITTPQGRSWSYVSGSGTIADPWIYGEAYSSTGALINSSDTAKTIKWPNSGYNGTGSGWADNDTTSYPEVSNSGTTINITRFNNAYFSFTDPYDGLMPSDYSSLNTLSVVPTEFTTIVPNGIVPVDGDGRELYYTIAKTAPSGQYNIYLDDVYYASSTHTSGTVSSAQVAGDAFAKNYKMYFGQVFTSSSLNTLVAEFTWSPKKAFCNFW